MRLVCRVCGTSREPGSVDYRCAVCGGELVAHLDDRVRRPGSAPGMWRYAEWLPTSGADGAYLGEGDTPVIGLGEDLRAHLGVASAAMKCEFLNPTGSFKDRIAAVAVALARERGLPGLVGTSSGNGGAAISAYGVRAGLDVTLCVLSDVVPAKLLQIRAYGGNVVGINGLGHDARSTEQAAVAIVGHAVDAGLFPFVTGGRYSPEAMEGAKTIAHELAEQAPESTVVYVPVGGGGLLSAMGRGFW
jgi:threonine synthase